MKLSCHCGNIAIEVEPPLQVTSCNCSVCGRYQSLWGYYSPDKVTVSIGAGKSSPYIWRDKEIAFIHCPVCGCVTHYETLAGQPDPKIAVNFRMAGESEVANIPVRHFDGAKLL